MARPKSEVSSALAALPGLDRKSAQMLAAVGVTDLRQAAQLGVAEIFRRLYAENRNPPIELAQALATAIGMDSGKTVDAAAFAELLEQLGALRHAAERTRPRRCEWCLSAPEYIAYHDDEWGVPEHDDQRLFELLTLEGAQAGLSWLTILRKREGYRRAFAGFDPARVAGFGSAQIEAILLDPGVVRHRGKIESTVSNARAVLALQAEFGSLAEFVWSFVDGRPRLNAWQSLSEIPATTDQSAALSRALLKRGFRFVGATTCYAFMQAAGLVCDHLVTCFRHPTGAATHPQHTTRP